MSQLSLQERIIDVTKPRWGFEASGAFFRPGKWPDERERKLVNLNPRPCHAHGRELVAEVLGAAEAVFPVVRRPTVYLFHFDTHASSNQAETWEEQVHNVPADGHGRPLTAPFIALYGKPTPIHPVVTRYLVAHEYGHVVCEVLALQHSSAEREVARDTFLRHYAELRGLQVPEGGYGPDTWQQHPEEVFANDFRVLMVHHNEEFWPHPGVPRPETLPHLAQWWYARSEEARQLAYLHQVYAGELRR